MFSGKKKTGNKFSRMLSNQKVMAFLGLIILAIIIFPLVKNINQRRRINKEMAELKEEIRDTGNKNNNLKEMIAYLESSQFAEEQARLNFGLKKIGEEVAVIEAGDKNTAGIATSDTETIFSIFGVKKQEPTKPLSNPGRWWKYFLN